jgi:hypothetical protein
MYTFDDNQGAWATRAQSEAAEDRALTAGKPVFFYLWPQYHDGMPSSFNHRRCLLAIPAQHGLSRCRWHLWGPSRFSWDEASGWWAATLDFIRQVG